MKTKREELIDFFNWLTKEYGYMVNHVVKSEAVDEYLKSINSDAPSESRNVATHEAKKKAYKSRNVKLDYVSATFDENRPPDKAR